MSADTARYAHTLPGRPEEQWERLDVHLQRVAELAAQFAAPFGAAEWGRLAGLWHDLGKYSEAFQRYLRAGAEPTKDGHRADVAGKVDHSTAGAQHAARSGRLGQLLAYVIAGHHAGLPDGVGGAAGLMERLTKHVDPCDAAPTGLLDQPLPQPPHLEADGGRGRQAFSIGFFTRMVYSCLVDADFLATEEFMAPDRAAARPGGTVTLNELLEQLDRHLREIEGRAKNTPVNGWRTEVLKACRASAEETPGLFSLHVPTGGGKTLSSLAFALHHASSHGLRRVIYAIPFTSIIEQTADVFRRALGPCGGAVLEHHSNLDIDDPHRQSVRSRLAAENFDAPIVVTTNVQLFESLFSCRSSRCRKLHRLAGSVIVLDEAQTLPPNLLAPTLAALDELARNYGTTIVLCTATLPAVERRDDFPIGLRGIRSIIPDSSGLHRALRRTETAMIGGVDDERLVERLRREDQVLCVVNSRGHSAALFRMLDDPQALHLSASLCGAHRSTLIDEIRRRLKDRRPCRVICTQVIEAGVDVDFPVVYRAAAGLDSVAQAAGRCNREGLLTDDRGRPALGRVFVFDYDQRLHRPPPFVQRAAAHAREVQGDHGDNMLAPPAIEAYFQLHYWQQGGDGGEGWDRGRAGASVMRCFGGANGDPLHHQFREATARYAIIEDILTPILVPYDETALGLTNQLIAMADPPGAWFDRAAQRYVVGVWDGQLRDLSERGSVVERHGRYCLVNQAAYDQNLGVVARANWDPAALTQ